MKCVLFCHAFSSCWNNGNAHFLRGVARELHALGHDVTVYEPAHGWSRLNAIRDGGAEFLSEIPGLFPGISIRQYDDDTLDIEQALDRADLVLVHEWNTPELIARIGECRVRGGSFTLLFHDTHHRAVTAPDDLERVDLGGYDGVLAFGEVLRDIYLRRGWADRAFTWHEAADTALYRPLPHLRRTHDIIWIGNWGDGERGAELNEFFVRPAFELGLRAQIYGVRYADEALHIIDAAGIAYRGWLPAHRVPAAFAEARATVHVPRGPYARLLPGIPTIRMFEAMACGIPIVSAPWEDCEMLLPADSYLRARNGKQMTEALHALLTDEGFASRTAAAGLNAIATRHTCRHRVEELLTLVSELKPRTASIVHLDEEATS
jgi:spore maturation protein CgeB